MDESIFEAVFKEYPLPWQLYDDLFLDFPCIRDFNDGLVLAGQWGDEKLFKLIVETVNNLHKEIWEQSALEI